MLFRSDVKGTPFLAPVAAPLPPDAATLGDTDSPRPGDIPPAAAALHPTPAAEPSAPAPGEPEPVSFDDLSGFEFVSYGGRGKDEHEVPAKIRALTGKSVVIDGFMMPLSYEAGGAKKFLLMRYRFGCCYAVAPKINEWIEVTMQSGVADYLPDTIDTVWGVLTVKEEIKDGVTTGLYTLKATRSELTDAR